MDTNEAQALAAGEIEGDANITIWDTALIKADVVVALNDMGIRITSYNVCYTKLLRLKRILLHTIKSTTMTVLQG